jgi:cytochrome b6-f complex iron-sulfur subunit
MERKDFLKQSLALAGLGFIPTVLVQSCSKQSNSGPTNVDFTLDLTAADNAALNTVGGSRVVNGVIVIRTSTTGFDALSSACTHEGCTVGYSATAAAIVCPCHNGRFNAATGAVISGPPPKALTKYTATLSGNILTVKS